MNLTAQQLKACMPLIKEATVNANLDALNKAMAAYEINTPIRVAHFLAQIAHESMHLNVVEENLNYSAAGLLKIFGKYFKTLEEAKKVERQPAAIANIVYANRLGNGNTASGDGYKFRGRGAIQNTGKVNYALLTAALGIDLVTNPDLLKLPIHSLKAAGHYWKSKGLNELADKDDALTITKRINGGTNGLEDRMTNLKRNKTILGIK
jgi:putative chitinase